MGQFENKTVKPADSMLHWIQIFPRDYKDLSLVFYIEG